MDLPFNSHCIYTEKLHENVRSQNTQEFPVLSDCPFGFTFSPQHLIQRWALSEKMPKYMYVWNWFLPSNLGFSLALLLLSHEFEVENRVFSMEVSHV